MEKTSLTKETETTTKISPPQTMVTLQGKKENKRLLSSFPSKRKELLYEKESTGYNVDELISIALESEFLLCKKMFTYLCECGKNVICKKYPILCNKN